MIYNIDPHSDKIPLIEDLIRRKMITFPEALDLMERDPVESERELKAGINKVFKTTALHSINDETPDIISKR